MKSCFPTALSNKAFICPILAFYALGGQFTVWMLKTDSRGQIWLLYAYVPDIREHGRSTGAAGLYDLYGCKGWVYVLYGPGYDYFTYTRTIFFANRFRYDYVQFLSFLAYFEQNEHCKRPCIYWLFSHMRIFKNPLFGSVVESVKSFIYWLLWIFTVIKMILFWPQIRIYALKTLAFTGIPRIATDGRLP